MRHRHEISNEDWQRIRDLLPGQPTDPGVTVSEEDNRRFINAVLWIAKTGAPWRDLPERFGPWNSVFQRFNRWSRKGVWRRIFEVLGEDADLEWVLLDSTVCRAHQHAAGQPPNPEKQALGRSRGGFSTKVHIAVDGLGNPVRIQMTPGQTADISQGPELLDGLDYEVVIADKGYDSDAFVEMINGHQTSAGVKSQAIIPPRKKRQHPRSYDKCLYKVRHLVECFIGKVKQFRRAATRYEKTARNFFSIWHIASSLILLK